MLLMLYISTNLIWCLSRVVSSLIVIAVTHFYCVIDCSILGCNFTTLNQRNDSKK